VAAEAAVCPLLFAVLGNIGRVEGDLPAFETMTLPEMPDVIAPDGSKVRVLLRLEDGSMAHFELGPGLVSIAVQHRTVAELWYVLTGRGEMWRRQGEQEEVVALAPGACLSIRAGTSFQFRSVGSEPLTAVAVTMPSWPGAQEAFEVVGIWQPALDGG
jgi:mannose-6-phosphate isomerase-like protein (cupin superfamily)